MVAFEHRTLNERVYIRIRELILSGSILSGVQLDEQSLADEMRNQPNSCARGNLQAESGRSGGVSAIQRQFCARFLGQTDQ